jgi:hypothetical protein
LSPSGIELGNPIMGSGIFVPEQELQEMKYSVKKAYTYTGEKQQLSIVYEEDDDNIKFEKGAYQIQVYVDEHLSGEFNFSLK